MILRAATQVAASPDGEKAITSPELAQPITLRTEAYRSLTEVFVGVSDEHRIQRFVRAIFR
jgi:hypothetical protein